MKKNRRSPRGPRGHYDLTRVRALVEARKVTITRNAMLSARRDFGWSLEDIYATLRRLQPTHFYKSEPSSACPTVVLDFYKAFGLRGRDIYIHFWIDEPEWLIVNSFKSV